MHSNEALYYLTIAEASALIRRHELSPVELTRAFLERIETLNDRLGAYVTVTAESALKDARAAESAIVQGEYRGPLHGIPVAHKDLYATEGIRTTCQSLVLLDWVPDHDATTVARLKEAGTLLLGKLAMTEFAASGPTDKPFPPARNPWNVDYNPGGSSSGSAAAVAAGLCIGALGSDTGGSIRNPASLCGVVGLKPTYGRVSRYGVVPLSWSLDHCGPLTWTVQDAALMLQALAGHDPKDPASSRLPVPDYSSALKGDVKGMVLGIPRRFFFDPQGMDSETLAAVEKAIEVLEQLGASTKVVDIPSLDYMLEACLCIHDSECYAYHEPNLKSQPHNYNEALRRHLRSAALYSAADYIQAQRVRALVKQEFDQVMTQVDALVTPMMIRPAWRFDQLDLDTASRLRYNSRPFNLTGQPAISVCCGFTSDGLPIGLQIAGRSFDEPTVLRIADAYERSTLWRQQRPPVEGLTAKTRK